LIRNPKDNIVSNKVNFDNNNITSLAYHWKYYNEKLLKLSFTFPESFYKLRYEDFVSNPEKYLLEICSFLEIDYNKEMLNFNQQVGKHFEGRPHFLTSLHKNLINPVNANEVNSWKNKLSNFEAKICDTIVYHTAKKFNYKIEYRNIYIYIYAFLGIVISRVTLKLKYFFFKYFGILFKNDNKTRDKWKKLAVNNSLQ
jgi:hypothetical protein